MKENIWWYNRMWKFKDLKSCENIAFEFNIDEAFKMIQKIFKMMIIKIII